MATVNWNGISLLLEQVRPPAGHPELGLRPNCSELSAYSDGAGTHWVASTAAGPRHLVVYPPGMDGSDALAYLAADGYCESAGAKVGTIPLAASLPAELRQQGYSHNQVPTELQLPAVQQVASSPTQAIAQTAAPSQGGGSAGFILLAAIVLGGVGFASYVLTQKPKAANTPTPAPTPTNTTNEPAAATGEAANEAASQPTAKFKEPAKPVSDFERANAELQELLGGFKNDV